MYCGNISWHYGIVYKSPGGPVWTAGTNIGVMESSIKVLEDWFGLQISAAVMESSIKVMENQLGLLEHHRELWNPLYSAGEPGRTAGTFTGVMESSIKVLANHLGPLEHHLEF